MTKIKRLIRYFNNDDEWLAGEIELRNISLDELLMLFPTAKDDPLMCYCYEINENNDQIFKDRMEVDFDYGKYCYFLESDAVN